MQAHQNHQQTSEAGLIASPEYRNQECEKHADEILEQEMIENDRRTTVLPVSSLGRGRRLLPLIFVLIVVTLAMPLSLFSLMPAGNFTTYVETTLAAIFSLSFVHIFLIALLVAFGMTALLFFIGLPAYITKTLIRPKQRGSLFGLAHDHLVYRLRWIIIALWAAIIRSISSLLSLKHSMIIFRRRQMRDDSVFSKQEDFQGQMQAFSISLPEQVEIFSVEATHSFEDIIEPLRTIRQPVILNLPEYGEAFNKPEHFQRLREHGFPEIVWFIIPPNRRDCLAHYAAQAGFSFSTSVEKAMEEYGQHFSSLQTVKNEPVEHEEQWHQTHSPSNALSREPSSSTEWPLLTATITRPQRHLPVIRLLSIITMIVLLLLILSLTLPFFTSYPRTGAQTTLPATALPQQVGELTFLSSELFNLENTQGYNDEVMLNMSGIRPPHPGMAYYAWLMPDTTNDEIMPYLLGKLTVNADKVAFSFSHPQHANMLLTYSGVRITEQASASTPNIPSADPKTWRWQGWIPNTPTPGDEHHYSLLSHLRHLLAKDPTLQENGIPGGLALWLTRNISKIEEWASAAQGQWHGTQTTDADNSLIQRHMLRILDYLDGQMYVWKDVPPGSSWLASPAGPGKLGLLNRIQNQDPPGFLEHVDIHLNGLANSIGSTQQQRQLAIEVDTVIRTINSDLEQVRKDASLIAHMTPAQMRQKKILPILDDMALLTSQDKSGWFDQQKGENVGGVLWVTSSLQQLATIPIRSV